MPEKLATAQSRTPRSSIARGVAIAVMVSLSLYGVILVMPLATRSNRVVLVAQPADIHRIAQKAGANFMLCGDGVAVVTGRRDLARALYDAGADLVLPAFLRQAMSMKRC